MNQTADDQNKQGRLSLIILGILSGLVIVGIVLMSLVYTGMLWVNMPSLWKYPIQGLDVSAHQGQIYWDFIDAKRWSFVYIKATEGGDFKDPRFQENWKNSRQSALKRGAYHFFTFCKPGSEQAQNFIDSVPVETGTLPPVVDLEFGGNCSKRPEKAEMLREIQTYLDQLETHYQQKPMLYVTRSFAQAYMTGGVLSEYPLWVRDILKKPEGLKGRPWTIWQYSNRGHMDALKGRVDLNAFEGSPQDFARLLKKSG